jgi:hypothetical protein
LKNQNNPKRKNQSLVRLLTPRKKNPDSDEAAADGRKVATFSVIQDADEHILICDLTAGNVRRRRHHRLKCGDAMKNISLWSGCLKKHG